MKKYKVYCRMDENSEWSDELILDPYIEAENEDAAIERAKVFVALLKPFDYEAYDYMVVDYEDKD